MIRLKNVSKNNDFITADYYPEDSPISKHVSLNCKTNEFSGALVGYDLETIYHLDHARCAMVEMASGKREIKDCKVMWY